MARRRQSKGATQPLVSMDGKERLLPSVAHWAVTEEYTLPRGKVIHRGDELSILGEPGRFKFLRHIMTDRGVEWVDVIGGPRKIREWRSFRPSRIGTVHRIKRMISDEEQRQLVNAKNRAKRGAQ